MSFMAKPRKCSLRNGALTWTLMATCCQCWQHVASARTTKWCKNTCWLFVFLATSHKCLSLSSIDYFVWEPWAWVLALPCWQDLIRLKQLSTAANTQAQCLSSCFFLLDIGVMPATYVAIMLICGYKLPRARMCGTCSQVARLPTQKGWPQLVDKNSLPTIVCKLLLWH